MTRIKIEKVIIGAFRNLTNKTFELDSNSCLTTFCGNNHIGKTNVLNAIMWCLTGMDLEDTKDIRQNIPNGTQITDDVPVVDVKVQLTTGSVRRTVVPSGKAMVTSVYINDTVVATKAAEAQIDKMLGILELAIAHNTSKFNVRRFLLNPLYIEKLTPTDFRQFVMSFIKDKVSYNDHFKKLNEIQQKVLSEIKNSHDPSVIGAEIKSLVSQAKTEIQKKLIIVEYLTNKHSELQNETESLRKEIQQKEQQLILLEQAEVANNQLAISIKQAYNEVCKDLFNGVEISLLEKSATIDSWVETCKPYLPNGVEFANGSTSEKIILASKLATSVLERENIDIRLPMLIDEWETVDSKSSFNMTLNCQTQIIAAQVKASKDNEIKLG